MRQLQAMFFLAKGGLLEDREAQVPALKSRRQSAAALTKAD